MRRDIARLRAGRLDGRLAAQSSSSRRGLAHSRPERWRNHYAAAPFSDEDAPPARIGGMVHWSRKGIRCLPMVNYDDLMILTELLDDNSDMVKGLMERFYARISCYSTSAFLHVKFGDPLRQRRVLHICESCGEAEGYLRGLASKSEL